MTADAQANQDSTTFFPGSVLTFGVGQGGSSIAGVDLEFLLFDNIGLQAGIGFIGYGAGINFHLKHHLRSSFVSLQYWHQGIGRDFIISSVGPAFVYRAKKWFTFTAGLGLPMKRGDRIDNSKIRDANLLIHLALGAYMPLGQPAQTKVKG